MKAPFHPFAALFALTLLALSSCSEGTTPSTPSKALVITHVNVIDELMSAVCDYLVRCDLSLGRTFDRKARCLDMLAFMFAADPEPSLDAIADPTLYSIDGDRAKACFQAVRTTACGVSIDTIFDGNPDCERTAVGRLVENDPCDDRDGCGPGLACEYLPAGGMACEPKPAGAGESCYRRACAAGLYCAASVCTAYAQLDTVCNPPLCDPSLYCDVAAAGGPLCALRKTATESCTADAECAGGLYCDTAAASPICVALRSDGQTCDANRSDGACASDLTCVNGSCTSPDWQEACDPVLGGCPEGFMGGGCYEDPAAPGDFLCMRAAMLDEACDLDGVTLPPCAVGHGFVCDLNTNRCVIMPRENEDCSTAVVCDPLPTLYCRVISTVPLVGTCAPRVGENEDCTRQLANDPFLSACVAGYTCAFGICQDPDSLR